MRQPNSGSGGSARQRMGQLASGALSGAITRTAMAPLERVKILYQLASMSDKPIRYHGVAPTLAKIYREEGFRGFFKGNLAGVTRIIPVSALKFTFNDTFKDIFAKPGQKLSFAQLILSSSLAGSFQILCTFPLGLIRTRLAMAAGLERIFSLFY